jgi:hypothetical protein
MPTNTVAAQVLVSTCNTQGGPLRSIRPTRSPGSNGRTSVTFRYNLSRSLGLTCAMALGPLAHSQPPPGGIATPKIPFSTLLSDSAGNLYFTGSASPGQIMPSPGAPQPQPGGGSCIFFPKFLPRPCTDAFLEKTDANGNILFATYVDAAGRGVAFSQEWQHQAPEIRPSGKFRELGPTSRLPATQRPESVHTNCTRRQPLCHNLRVVSAPAGAL